MPSLRPPGALLTLALLALALLGSARAALAEVKYETEITGVDEDKQLRGDLEALSQLVKLEDRPPPSDAALRRRADDDLERLRPALQAAGYWAGQLSYTIDFDADPPKVTIHVDTGPRYTLHRVTFETPDGGTPIYLDHYHPIAFGLELGGPARTAPILAAEGRIAEEYAKIGHPFAKVTDRRVVVDHAPHTMDVTYVVVPGPEVRFGRTTIVGLDRLDPSYVENRIAWKAGDIYDSRQIEETRKALTNSGLFTTVRIGPDEARPPASAGARVPITVTLAERLPRSIGAGLRYDTSEGFGARAFWEHRNLFGHAERLRVSADFAQQRLGLLGNFRVPDFFRTDQDFVAEAELADDTPPAYDSRRLAFFSGVERRFGPALTGGAGLRFEQAFIDTPNLPGGSANYTLIGAPVYARRDTTNDLLNPRSGTRSSLSVTPWSSVAGQNVSFVSSRFIGSAYRDLSNDNSLILAGYGAIGEIFGASRDALPPDKRHYAGGGGSVRGYGYQLAGPIGVDNTPIGGRSSLELGVELRIKITDSIGLVPFLEAGNVYETLYPTGRLLFGAGLGVRYYTPVGPVRLDIGFPINKRAVDDPVQFYISLGQAF
jgi:translocation and assembly module TamA